METTRFSPSCLEEYTVEERIITRWNPEQRREDQPIVNAESRTPQASPASSPRADSRTLAAKEEIKISVNEENEPPQLPVLPNT
ncbi:hypothetical protein GIB67_026002 [Kingdonia uniflora]|uniref:Uncharacterized protein n=1 Tax=Kingdonia uniflora TaxID=39325 RepID=A0A7J7M2S1_9MAGN|nr:hypothetical protein GIB67_026002 [Kingdonia uniflora]